MRDGAQTKIGSWSRRRRATPRARVALLAVVAIAVVLPAAGELPRAAFADPSTDLLDVVQVGDGSTPLTSAATATFVQPLRGDGTLGTRIALPTSGPHPFASSGSAGSEGALNLSQDGNYLTLLGYGAVPGTTGVNGGDSINDTASTSVPRVIARVDAAGDVDTSTALSDAFSGSNARGVVSSDGTHFWATGDGGGNGKSAPSTVITGTNASIVYVASLGATTSTPLVTSPKQSRVPVIAGGNLYYSTSKTTPGILQIGSGLPTTTASPTLVTPTNSHADPYGFVFVHLGSSGSAPDTLYAADDAGNGGSATPALDKFGFNGTSWVAEGSIAALSATAGLGSLTGKVEGSNVQLYATTNDGTKVLALTDTSGFGNTISGSFSTVATAPANTVYRGIAFAPTGQTLSPVPTVTVSDAALSHTIGDAYEPTTVTATVADATAFTADQLTVTATSSDPSVVPTVSVSGNGTTGPRTITVTPADVVGLSTITVTATTPDDVSTSASFEYGVSAAAPDAASNYLYGSGSDASTAIDVGGGYFIVADDEYNALALYRGGVSGPPVKTWDFSSQLPLQGELDLEASARAGTTLYWTGSMGNSSSGNVKPERSILFATTLSGSGASAELTFVGAYAGLRTDLIAWDHAHGDPLGFSASAADGQIAKEINGFNLEGMEFAPGSSSTVYLGFRAPLEPTSSRTKALVVPLTNIQALVGSSPPTATFGTAIEWNLTPTGYANGNGDASALGIREIRKNADDQYLVLAGSYEGVPAAPSGGSQFLYSWDGDPADQPVLTNTVLPTPDGGSWESIVATPDPLRNGSSVELIEDDGSADFYDSGQEAKDLAFGLQKDHLDVLTLALPSASTGSSGGTSTGGTSNGGTSTGGTSTSTATVATGPTASTAVTPGSATTLPVGTGANAVTVVLPAGAVTTAATLTVTAATITSAAGVGFAGGTTAVRVSVESAGGAAITQFAAPLDLQFPDAPASTVPAYSADGGSWTQIPQITSPPALPSGWPDGWYRDSAGTLHILTRHATYFGLLAPGARVTKAFQLTATSTSRVNLDYGHEIVLHLQPTFPAALTITLRRGNAKLATWHRSLTTDARAVTIALPKAARHPGSETVVATATAPAGTATQTMGLTLVARWNRKR